jgi:Reverse transcriptase (RNA-dependent DNA polymerase)
MDDIVITRDDTVEIKNVEERLSREFKMKNLSDLKYLLGTKVTRYEHEIILSQRKYIVDLVEVGMFDCKPADTPAI